METDASECRKKILSETAISGAYRYRVRFAMGAQSIPLVPPIETAALKLAAIHALSDREKKSLHRFAHWRMLPIAGIVRHSDDEDLYNEAIIRTLDDRREWKSAEKTMFQHLLGCISSIADEWYKEAKRYGELSDVHASPDTLLAQVTRKIFFERLERKLKRDAVGLTVFESLLKGEKPFEAIDRLKIRKKVYEAARRRVVRQGQRDRRDILDDLLIAWEWPPSGALTLEPIILLPLQSFSKLGSIVLLPQQSFWFSSGMMGGNGASGHANYPFGGASFLLQNVFQGAPRIDLLGREPLWSLRRLSIAQAFVLP